MRRAPVVVLTVLCLVGAAAVAQAPSSSATSRGAHPVPVPRAAGAVNTSHPTRVVGHGTAASCTSAAVVAAVARGGIIRFACGPRHVTIRMTRTAKIRNTHPRTVLDGQGRVTLSGMGRRRILYQDTCDPNQVWTTSHCQNQAGPTLVVQNLTFIYGNSTGQDFDGGGGGAIFVRGGQFRVVNSNFYRNRCELRGPDIGGGAVRVLSQYANRPVWIVRSRFHGNVGSNGAALSSIGVSWNIRNSRFIRNHAVGHGANPPHPGTVGGGSGGALYTDGNRFTVSVAGTLMQGNVAEEGGGALFMVSNDRTGTMAIGWSTLSGNPSRGFQTPGLPGIYFLGARRPNVSHSILR